MTATQFAQHLTDIARFCDRASFRGSLLEDRADRLSVLSRLRLRLDLLESVTREMPLDPTPTPAPKEGVL